MKLPKDPAKARVAIAKDVLKQLRAKNTFRILNAIECSVIASILPYFSGEQISAIETAFESDPFIGFALLPDRHDVANYRLHCGIETDHQAMVWIMSNIIRNKGTFEYHDTRSPRAVKPWGVS